MRPVLPLLSATLTFAACSSTINTLPPVTDARAPIQEITLQIPAGLEVKSVNYNATMYANVSGTSGNYGVTSTDAGGRAFVQVVAVDRDSGEQVLLLYENITQRPAPFQIIRFRTER
jgi:hypothetical protein